MIPNQPVMSSSAAPLSRRRIGNEYINRLADAPTKETASVETSRQRHPWKASLPIIILLLLTFLNPVGSQEVMTENVSRIKAAFIRNFARYVIWPDQAFTDSNAPWRICILGKNPFDHILDKTLTGRTEQGRSFEIHLAETLEEAPPCQMIYITYDTTAERRAALDALKGKPVLTIGDANDFLSEGGTIQFRVGERVQMSVNLDRAKADSLGIQTKMLEVATEVLENGKLRKAR